MKKTITVTFMTAVLAVTSIFADEGDIPGFEPYLGLAIPYPDSIPELTLSLEKNRSMENESLLIMIEVDRKGRVQDIAEFPSDSIEEVNPIATDIMNMQFDFLKGREIEYPVSIPVEVHFSGRSHQPKKVELRFPIRPDRTADPHLLLWFFDSNGIAPPEPIHLPPVYYNVHPEKEDSPFHTVTVLLSLDETGELLDVAFPIKGQDIMTHPVLITLMNGSFSPAYINGVPTPSKFLMTFRIFDNLKYPIDPLVEADSANSDDVTRKFFATRYFNNKDITIFPLPRNYPCGTIHSAKWGRGKAGFAEINIQISTEGVTKVASIIRTTEGLEERSREIIGLARWYPAYNHLGEPQPFAGRVSLNFDGTTKVVYIPEWLEP